LKKLLARGFLRLAGWKAEGTRPRARTYVLIAAPHTSAWDLVYLLALAWSLELRIAWMGKRQLFRFPFGPLMRWLGGIPIDRERGERRVDQMVEWLPRAGELALVVPAEGTRRYAPHWKSGFYWIALGAGVPIVMGYLDFARRRGGFGPELVPTGDVSRDMDRVRAFYADKVGRYPQQASAVRLEQELAPGAQRLLPTDQTPSPVEASHRKTQQ